MSSFKHDNSEQMNAIFLMPITYIQFGKYFFGPSDYTNI